MDFSDFYEAQAEDLLKFCWMLTLDSDEAADLAQEAMEQAYRRWDSLSGPDHNPAGWIRTVAVNASRSRHRRLRRLVSLLPRLASGTNESLAVASDPDLADALQRLAVRQRQVIALRYWADLPLAECASEMGISLGSVKQHLARAHRNLAAELTPEGLEGLVL